MNNPSSDEMSEDAEHEPLASASPSELPASGPTETQTLETAILALHQQGWNGASWFFWVAGLSLVNSVILLTGGDMFFVIGLAVTLVADAIATGIAQQAADIGNVVKVIAFAFDVVVALVVVAFGWLARKRYLAAFAIGMALYLLDGLAFVAFEDWMSAGFHAFALFCMWRGFTAYRRLGVLERDLEARLAEGAERGATPAL